MMLLCIRQALDMLKTRRTRTTLAIVQFSIGLFALSIMALLVLHIYQVSMVLQSSFTSTRIARLSAMGNAHNQSHRFTLSDLAELRRMPGIEQAGVFWHGWADLLGEVVRIYIVDNEMESIIRLQTSHINAVTDPQSSSGVASRRTIKPGYVYASPHLYTRLAKEYTPHQQFNIKINGSPLTTQLGGIVQPVLGWPSMYVADLAKMELYDNYLVVDFSTVTAILPNINIDGSVWLSFAANDDYNAQKEALKKWYRLNHTGLDLEFFSVAEAISTSNPWQNPGTKVSLVMAIFLLMQSTIGFTGQCLLMTELRRGEWALRMALGATKRELMTQVVLETAFVICTASILALFATILIAPTVRASMQGSWLVFGISRYIALAIMVVIVSFVIATIAALQPIGIVAASEPSVVLKSEV